MMIEQRRCISGSSICGCWANNSVAACSSSVQRKSNNDEQLEKGSVSGVLTLLGRLLRRKCAGDCLTGDGLVLLLAHWVVVIYKFDFSSFSEQGLYNFISSTN
jgi:hypothetical protein